MKVELPLWFLGLTVQGCEQNSSQESDQSESHDAENDSEANSSSNPSDGADDSANSNSSSDEVTNLRNALANERKLRRRLEREARKKPKEKPPSGDPSEPDAVRQELNSIQDTNRRLAESLRRREIDSAILEEARRQNFIDPTDALTDEVRRGVEVDQDEDHLDDVEVDEDTVRAAVQKLASRKKHLVGQPSSSGPSGSRIKKKTSTNDEPKGYDHLYPALREF